MMTAYMPAKIARFVAGWYQMDVDGRLVIFTVVLALGTALVFGLVPAFQASRAKLAESLKEGGRSSTAGVGRLRLRRGLVVAEMALALPLLVASALSVVTVHRFLNGPQGYEPDQLLTMRLVLASGRYADAPAYRRFAIDAVDRLRAMPGVAGRSRDQHHAVGRQQQRTHHRDRGPAQPGSLQSAGGRLPCGDTPTRSPCSRFRSCVAAASPAADREGRATGRHRDAVACATVLSRYRSDWPADQNREQTGRGSLSWASPATSSTTGSIAATIRRCIDRSCRRRAARWLCW